VALHVVLFADDGMVTAANLETSLASCGATPDEALRMFDEAASALFAATDADPDAVSPFATPAPAGHWRSLRGSAVFDAAQIDLAGHGPVPRLAYLLDEPPGQ